MISAPQGNVEEPIPEPMKPVFYTGSPLPAAGERKNLLIASFDSPIVGNWIIKSEEGTSNVPGKIGHGLSFGPGKLVLSDGATFANSGTLSFWLKLESEPSSKEAPIINWNFDGSTQQFSLFELSYVEGILQFNLYEESGNQDDIHAQIDTSWHLIDVIWDVTKEPFKRVMYIDGKKAAESGLPFAPLTRKPALFQIGGTPANRGEAKFTIDELVLTNYAKSGEEIVGSRQ